MGFLVEYLIVAGGGGGGYGGSSGGDSGGGGGGGFAFGGSFDMSYSGAYNVVIGGGAGPTGAGGNSYIDYIGTAVGGGAGGSWGGAGGAGGTGGGGGGGTTAGGSPSQGGGGGVGASTGRGGGGGGAAAGGAGASSEGGAGGTGFYSAITTAGVYYGGGGGGGGGVSAGAGGAGGGGYGASSGASGYPGGAGAHYYGGGGGGGTYQDGYGARPPGAGGHGVCIIRYPGAQVCSGGTVTSAGGYTIHTFYGTGVFYTPAPPVPTITQIDNTTTGAVNDIYFVRGGTYYTHVWGTNLLAGTYGNVSGTGVTAPYAAGSGTLIALNITVAADAPIGARTLTVTNANGTSNGLTIYIVPQPPVLSHLDAATYRQGTVNLYSHAYGSYFQAPSVFGGGTYGVFSGTGATAPFAAYGNEGLVALHFNIAADAPLGTRTFHMVTPGASAPSNAINVTIIPQPPTLTGLSVTSGFQRQTLYVEFYGTHFVNGGTTPNLGPGITVMQTYFASSTYMAFDIAIAHNAAIGPRSFTVTTAGGTSNAATFTVLLYPQTAMII